MLAGGDGFHGIVTVKSLPEPRAATKGTIFREQPRAEDACAGSDLEHVIISRDPNCGPGNPCESFGSHHHLVASRTWLGRHPRNLPNQRAIWVSSQNPQANATSIPFKLVVWSKVIACCTWHPRM